MGINSVGTKIIRDFIYVDQGRLYSFYSQLNKGIAEHIFQSIIHGEASTQAQANPEISDEVTESEKSKSLQRTESTILYDYMYEQLEEQLQHEIIDLSKVIESKADEEIPTEDIRSYLDTLRSSVMIKVKGRVEIEDYERLKEFLGNSNELMQAFAILHTYSNEAQDAKKALEEKLAIEKDRNQKAIIREQIKKLTNARLHAEQLGLLTDDEALEALTKMIAGLYGSNFEIAIISEDPPYSTFRGVINREWLRIEPELLRALYSGKIESTWTLVGQITSMQMFKATNLDSFNDIDSEKLSQLTTLREPIRALFSRLRAMEAMVNESTLRHEVVVCPLAIYREMRITSV